MLNCASVAQEAATPIPRSGSPNGSYSLRLGYNTEGPEGPIVEIVDSRSRVLGRTEYPTDASEKSPQILWSPKSTAVALNSKQRNYTSLTVLRLSADKNRFLDLEVPDLVALSGGRIKSTDELLPRAFVAARKWIDDKTLLVHASMMLRDKRGTELTFAIKLQVAADNLLITEIKEVRE
jgi:hypothetical protein